MIQAIQLERIYVYTLAVLPNFIFSIYFMRLLYNEKISFLRSITFIFVPSLILGLSSGLFYGTDDTGAITVWSTLLMVSSMYLTFFIAPILYVKSFSIKSATLSLFLISLYSYLVQICASFLYQFEWLHQLPQPLPLIFQTFVLPLLLVVPYIILIKKIDLPTGFLFFFKTKKRSIITLIITMFIFCSDVIVGLFAPNFSETYPAFISIIALVIILASLIVAIFYQQTKDKILTQEALLLEQQSYVQTLEDIQSDMRVLQHDYKNMLSGLYLQAEAGESESIKNYLDETLQQFDGAIGKKLLQTTQVKNIGVSALKSLVLTKLMEMERLGIPFELEVLKPIKSVAMDMNNLNRCLGILLDNAIEATKQLEQIKPITLIVSSEATDVTIIVKNTFHEKPLIHKIWEKGYSTKEQNTGLGLFSLQQIINSYSNVVKQTICDDEAFTQILTINN